jgi:hypothetical protein
LAWGTAFTAALGFAVGFRLHGTAGQALFAFGLCLACGFAFLWVFVCIGLGSSNAQAAQGSSMLAYPVIFVSSAYVRVNALPGWMQPVANHQLARLRAALDLGPAAYGWAEDQRWTLARVTKLIRRLFRVEYTLRGVSYLLHRMGFSWHVPAHRAAEAQVVDIGVVRTVTEILLPGLSCPCCGTATFAEPPPGAHAVAVSYGPVLNAAAVLLQGGGSAARLPGQKTDGRGSQAVALRASAIGGGPTCTGCMSAMREELCVSRPTGRSARSRVQLSGVPSGQHRGDHRVRPHCVPGDLGRWRLHVRVVQPLRHSGSGISAEYEVEGRTPWRPRPR